MANRWHTTAALLMLAAVALAIPPCGTAALPESPTTPAAETQTTVMVAGYNGQSTASTSLSLPLVARGQHQTIIHIQNVASEAANVTIDFYDLTGVAVTQYTGAIPPSGALGLRQETMDSLPPDFRGSALVASTQPVIATVEVNATDVPALLSYEGADEGAIEVILPLIMRNFNGQTTDFWVQNLTAVEADISITFTSQTPETPFVVTDTVGPHASHIYRQADLPELGDSFLGHVLVEASEPVAVVAQIWAPAAGRAAAYSGLDAAALETGFVSPWQTRELDGWSSAILMLNPGDMNVDAASTWFDTTGTALETRMDTIDSHSTMAYHLPSVPGLPDGFQGASLTESTGILASLSQWMNPAAVGDDLAVLTGIPLGSSLAASRQVYLAHLPRAARMSAGQISTRFSVQNLSGEGAYVDVYFHDQSGMLTAATTGSSIPAQGVSFWDTQSELDLGDNWQGTVTIESTQPVAVQAIEHVELAPAAEANLSVQKQDDLDPVTLAEIVTYDLTVSNEGPDEATSVTLTDTLPSSLVAESVTTSQGTCSGKATITCDLGGIHSGMSVTVSVALSPTVTGSFTNTAAVDAVEADPNPADNLASEITGVVSGTTSIAEPESGATLVYTETEGTSTNLEVPAGSLEETTKLVLAPLDDLPEARLQRSAPLDYVYLQRGFDLRAYRDGVRLPALEFSQAATITLSYLEETLKDTFEPSLQLRYWTETGWVEVEGGTRMLDEDANLLVASIARIGRFGLFATEPYRIYVPLTMRSP